MAITSPGSSVQMLERKLMSRATGKIISRVFAFCIVSPESSSEIARFCGSAISSAVTMAGPSGAKVSKLLPMIHWLVSIWTSRALTSFTMV